ncbi:MAG: DUF58 domain-containing protein [Candidatus Cloacimonetes bacterium]|nr:DUF58 domain-containing protein [Candidatus Cloacimonadota bacterium]
MDTSEILKKIRKIEITTRKLVNDIFSGEYHSMFKGHGLEFSEVREYQPGDSFKEIDWNVTARYNYPYIKKFKETRELNVLFLIDGSASTFFGTQNMLKNDLIAEIAALLSFSALSNNDKVGMLLFTDKTEIYSPPRKGKKNALKIIRDILYYTVSEKTTNLESAIKHIWSITKKKSIIFILSDFIADDYEHSLKILAKKHDVIAFKINDPAEMDLPAAGIIDFVDPETGDLFTVNTLNPKLRQLYRDEVEIKNREMTEFFKKNNIDMVNLYTNRPYIKDLMKFFKLRAQKRK